MKQALPTIFKIIGVNPSKAEDIKSDTARQNSEKLYDIIETYEEVRAALLGTQHEWYF